MSGGKFTDMQRGAIQLEYRAGGVSQRELARKYNVTQASMQAMLRGKDYSELVKPIAPSGFAPVVGSVEPAEGFTRRITSRIRTSSYMRSGWIKAEYIDVAEYDSPLDATMYTTFVMSGHGKDGKWNGKWTGTVTIQAPEIGEVAALASLLRMLDDLKLPYEEAVARGALVALASATETTPWQYRPIGTPGRKPRAATHRLLDRETGKRVSIYKDTLRPHRDPECKCRLCISADAILKPNTKRSRKQGRFI